MSWCDLDLTVDLAVVNLSYKSCLGYILVTLRCRELILGRDTGWGCRCAVSYDFHWTFGLGLVTLTFKILSRLYQEAGKCSKLILGRTLLRVGRCATSWCDLDLTFDLAIMTISLKIWSKLFLGFHKV